MEGSQKSTGDYSTEFRSKVVLYGGQYGNQGHEIDRDVIALPITKYVVGERVKTPDGPGTVEAVERHNCLVHPLVRYGVKHDVFPEHKPKSYKDDILYYPEREIDRP